MDLKIPPKKQGRQIGGDIGLTIKATGAPTKRTKIDYYLIRYLYIKNLYDKIYGQQLPRKGKGWHRRKEKARPAKNSWDKSEFFCASGLRPALLFLCVCTRRG